MGFHVTTNDKSNTFDWYVWVGGGGGGANCAGIEKKLIFLKSYKRNIPDKKCFYLL